MSFWPAAKWAERIWNDFKSHLRGKKKKIYICMYICMNIFGYRKIAHMKLRLFDFWSFCSFQNCTTDPVSQLYTHTTLLLIFYSRLRIQKLASFQMMLGEKMLNSYKRTCTPVWNLFEIIPKSKTCVWDLSIISLTHRVGPHHFPMWAHPYFLV